MDWVGRPGDVDAHWFVAHDVGTPLHRTPSPEAGDFIRTRAFRGAEATSAQRQGGWSSSLGCIREVTPTAT